MASSDAGALLLLRDGDSVAVAVRDLPAGAEVAAGGRRLVLRGPVPFGHKVAVRPIAAGEPVVKYGAPIGRATRPIAPGEHVHGHNLRSDHLASTTVLEAGA
jgi:altronate hydrolase